MLSVANNVASMTAQHNLGRSSSALNRSIERLSSGLKINRGADGPAALVISEQQRAQIAGLNQAIENTEKAVSVVQTAEGALNEINSLLTKVRSLAIDSANSGVNNTKSLAANQAEIDNALDTINRIANNTQFGTKKLIDGSLASSKVLAASITSFNQSGVTKGVYSAITDGNAVKRTISTDLTDTNSPVLTDSVDADSVSSASTFDAITTLSVNNGSGGVLASYTASSGETISSALANLQTQVDAADVGVTVSITDGVGTTDAFFTLTAKDYGTYANAYTFTMDNGLTNGSYTTAGGTDTAGANGAVTGTLATAVGGLTMTGNRGNQFQNASGTVTIGLNDTIMATGTTVTNAVEVADGAVFQIGANKDQTAAVSIGSAKHGDLGHVGSETLSSLLTGGNRTVTGGQAQNALAIIDQAIDDISGLRGDLGAFQANTLESTANNLRATLENTVAAESVIRDTDFAMEMAEFTKQQVLVQAGTSILSSANQNSQLVLSLLG